MSRLSVALSAAWTLVMLPAYGQMRPNHPAVLAPPTRTSTRSPGIMRAFHSAYEAAGAPRIMLFWNTSFGNSSGSARPKSDTLSARTVAELDAAFRRRLLHAGVRLYGRAANVRFTEARRDRAGVDPRLVEADAVLHKADILLQILLVPDRTAPLGSGFQISAVNVKTGAEVLSLYTRAQPKVHPPAGRYVATNGGFVWRQPPAQAPTVRQVAIELAKEILRSLGPTLTKVSAHSGHRRSVSERRRIRTPHHGGESGKSRHDGAGSHP